MPTDTASAPKVVSRKEWLEARNAFLAQEEELTYEMDWLRAERQRLPWVKIEKHYVFQGPEGICTLTDLFAGRSQLAVYHFLLAPASDHVCKECSLVADHIDGAQKHFGAADLSFAAVSRAPIERINYVKRHLGWTFPWVSSHGNDFDFDFDFGVSFKAEDIALGRAIFNLQASVKSEDIMGTNIFFRRDTGDVFHTYSAFGRGIENLMGVLMWLDLTPKGRNEFDAGRSRLSEGQSG